MTKITHATQYIMVKFLTVKEIKIYVVEVLI